MPGSADQALREDALAIWQAGLAAVDSEQLVRRHLQVVGGELLAGQLRLPLDAIDRITIIGAGKAGAGMAAGAIGSLGSGLCRRKQVSGWVNVPDDCVRQLPHVRLHGARPAGVNEPTRRGLDGTRRILAMVSALGERDLCLCLLSGGGSALLPAPVRGVPLAEKQALVHALSARGAKIQQLNTVRKALSEIKGGGLARACRAGRMIVLLISDVRGDPPGIIASGPAWPEPGCAREALAIWQRFGLPASLAPRAYRHLAAEAARPAASRPPPMPPRLQLHHQLIGNNALAVSAARAEAKRRGYRVEASSAAQPDGDANQLGQALARRALALRTATRPETQAVTCLISGGEPTVELAPAARRGIGGRNQQVVLAAFEALRQQAEPGSNFCAGLVILSGATDGEDGTAPAAGAWADADLVRAWQAQTLDPADHLARNDAWTFFQRYHHLLVTGPTHTNVCDIRVVLAGPATRAATPGNLHRSAT
jgi:hydroxypyruvate reductase